MGIFDQCDAAFAPLADETVIVTGRRNGESIEATLKACVLEGALDEPLDGDSIASTRRTVEVLFPRAVWPFDSSPQVGDRIELSDESVVRPLSAGYFFAVTAADVSVGMVRLSAREIPS